MTVSMKSFGYGNQKERPSSRKNNMRCDEFILSLTTSKWHWLLSCTNILNHTANAITEGLDEAQDHVSWKNASLTLQIHVRRTKIKFNSHSFHLRK